LRIFKNKKGQLLVVRPDFQDYVRSIMKGKAGGAAEMQALANVTGRILQVQSHGGLLEFKPVGGVAHGGHIVLHMQPGECGRHGHVCLQVDGKLVDFPQDTKRMDCLYASVLAGVDYLEGREVGVCDHRRVQDLRRDVANGLRKDRDVKREFYKAHVSSEALKLLTYFQVGARWVKIKGKGREELRLSDEDARELLELFSAGDTNVNAVVRAPPGLDNATLSQHHFIPKRELFPHLVDLAASCKGDLQRFKKRVTKYFNHENNSGVLDILRAEQSDAAKRKRNFMAEPKGMADWLFDAIVYNPNQVPLGPNPSLRRNDPDGRAVGGGNRPPGPDTKDQELLRDQSRYVVTHWQKAARFVEQDRNYNYGKWDILDALCGPPILQPKWKLVDNLYQVDGHSKHASTFFDRRRSPFEHMRFELETAKLKFAGKF